MATIPAESDATALLAARGVVLLGLALARSGHGCWVSGRLGGRALLGSVARSLGGFAPRRDSVVLPRTWCPGVRPWLILAAISAPRRPSDPIRTASAGKR